MTPIVLRPYQRDHVANYHDAWNNGAAGVLGRLATGGGKTKVFSSIIREHQGASCLMAHRNELVGQISMTLAENGVHHTLIASDKARREIARLHVEEFGRCFYSPGAPCAVASVDTLVRASGLESWARQVTLVVPDEAHHVLRKNKWGRAIETFQNSARKLLMPTATPGRADGQGLGSHADGYADVMFEGPPERWLIEQGFLTDYKLYCPPSDIAVLAAPGASGDWSTAQLRDAAKRSHIVGDVVMHYSKWAMGKRALTFCTDVETATETCAAFNAAGIPSAVLTGETDTAIRREVIRRLKAGEILNICAVDIISEGFDLPAVECVILARPTQSLSLYMQQFGRALRLLAGKLWAIIIDAVSNTLRFGGPPDKPRVWSLDRREKRAKTAATDGIPIRVCARPITDEWPVGCFQPYERIEPACPYCGYVPPIAVRSGPASVDGDLAEMDAETLARLRGAVTRMDMDDARFRVNMLERRIPERGQGAEMNRHRRDRTAQDALRASMATWAGWRKAEGMSDAKMQRLFFHTFGQVSVLEAMALRFDEAHALRERIDAVVNGG